MQELSCTICGLRFRNRYSLIAHVEDRHNKSWREEYMNEVDVMKKADYDNWCVEYQRYKDWTIPVKNDELDSWQEIINEQKKRRREEEQQRQQRQLEKDAELARQLIELQRIVKEAEERKKQAKPESKPEPVIEPLAPVGRKFRPVQE